MQKVKKIDENGNVTVYDSAFDAAKSVKTRFTNWKVQLFIVSAIIRKGTAFKCRWEAVK